MHSVFASLLAVRTLLLLSVVSVGVRPSKRQVATASHLFKRRTPHLLRFTRKTNGWTASTRHGTPTQRHAKLVHSHSGPPYTLGFCILHDVAREAAGAIAAFQQPNFSPRNENGNGRFQLALFLSRRSLSRSFLEATTSFSDMDTKRVPLAASRILWRTNYVPGRYRLVKTNKTPFDESQTRKVFFSFICSHHRPKAGAFYLTNTYLILLLLLLLVLVLLRPTIPSHVIHPSIYPTQIHSFVFTPSFLVNKRT